MKGLLYKELWLMLKNGKAYLLCIAVFGVVFSVMMFVPLDSVADADAKRAAALQVSCLLLSLLCTSWGIDNFFYDTQAKWDMYAVSLPVGRASILACKYGLAVLGTAVGFLLPAVVGAAVGLAYKGISWGALMGGAAAAALVSLMYAAILLPVQIKFGAENNRAAMVACFLVVFMGAYLFICSKALNHIANALAGVSLPVWLFAVSAVVLAVGACAVSYGISLRIYGNKEF